MKRVLFYLLLAGIPGPRVFAQEIQIKAIPYPLYFDLKPRDFQIRGENELTITAAGNTNLFISPDGGFEQNTAPRLLFSPGTDFIFTSRIQTDFKAPSWDAGVLLVYNDPKHYAKFCFENDYTGQPRVVSVVCNETGDDCNSMAVDKKDVYYRIIGSAGKNSFSFYYSADGEKWYLVRSFKLDKFDNIRVGFSAQSPIGEECSVLFSAIELQERKPADWWKGE